MFCAEVVYMGIKAAREFNNQGNALLGVSSDS